MGHSVRFTRGVYEEAVGQSIKLIIPPERHGEEREILARLRRGEPIKHYETIRVAKDGRRIDISLTISPLRDSNGNLIGASKIARDITYRRQLDEERKRAAMEQRLLADVATIVGSRPGPGGIAIRAGKPCGFATL